MKRTTVFHDTWIREFREAGSPAPRRFALCLASLAVALGCTSAAAQSFTLTGSMAASRSYPTATLLPNGQVLIAGGEATICTPNCSPGPLSSAELYNPQTGAFTPTGSMTTARQFHTATLLDDGKVLIA